MKIQLATNHKGDFRYFYLAARKTSNNYVSLIFPTGWQQPKNANNLSKLNNEEEKTDCQIVRIDNCQNIFPGISGAEWINIILWKKGCNNGLNGYQNVLTNGQNLQVLKLSWVADLIEKPLQIVELGNIIKHNLAFRPLQEFTSMSKQSTI